LGFLGQERAVGHGTGIARAHVKAGGALVALSQQVLRTDASGMPLEWIDYKEAVRLHCLGQVAYAFGSRLYALHGGDERSQRPADGHRGQLDDGDAGHPGNPGSLRGDYVPPLNNETLFRRDANLCMYAAAASRSTALARPRAPVLPGRQGRLEQLSSRPAAAATTRRPRARRSRRACSCSRCRSRRPTPNTST
jgi:hypothetical protein